MQTGLIYVLLTEKYQILSSAFYEDGCVLVSKTIDESFFAIDYYFNTLTTCIIIIECQNYPIWGPSTQNIFNLYIIILSTRVIAIQVLSHSDNEYRTTHKLLFLYEYKYLIKKRSF